jgi:hypothetical protein
LLGGIGYHSPLIFLLLACIVAILLWPLGALSCTPTLWDRTRWRKAIVVYLAALACAATVAGWQMTQTWGLFFG